MKYWLRRFLREERAKLKKMSFPEAVKYIWQYFGLFIVLFIGIVWLAIFGISRLIAGEPEYWLYVSFANSPKSVSDSSPIWRDFAAYSGYDTDEKKIEFTSNMYFEYNGSSISGREYFTSFVALADTGTLDIITMSPEQLAPLGQSGQLMVWTMEECADLLERYGDRLIYYEPPEGAEQTEPLPVGIDVSDSLIVTKYGIYPQNCALGITANTQRLDAITKFLDFIYS